MNSPNELLDRIGDPALSNDQKVALRCDLAKYLEQCWNFEAAEEAMGQLWQCLGERPVLDGLTEQSKALVLLRAGALTGWLGSAKHVHGAQKLAKHLITESIGIFESIGRPQSVAEAQIDLAYCYWREGALEDARAMLQRALAGTTNLDDEMRVIGMLRSAAVEKSAKRPHDALHLLNVGAAFSERIDSDVIKGKVHNQLGLMLKYLGHTELRRDYLEQAMSEFTSAIFYFNRARLPRHQARAENNLGLLYGSIGLFAHSHQHLDRAHAIYTQVGDTLFLAQTDDSRARVLLKEGRLQEAEELIKDAERVLEECGEQSLMADALALHGVVLTRMQDYEQAHATLERAAEVAAQAGDPERAGLATLTLVEQLGYRLSSTQLCAAIECAGSFLETTSDLTAIRRLERVSRQALLLSQAYPGRPDWSTFNLKEVQLRNECRYVEQALEDADGSVTKAAELLGLASHQSLLFMLNGRLKNLVSSRTPIKRRRRSIMPKCFAPKS